LKPSLALVIETEAIGLIISMLKEQKEDSRRVRFDTVELAIQLLQNKYKICLSQSYFLAAVDFLTIKTKASAFITLNSIIQDIWLCKNTDVELI
jgi:hypothetical protein